MAGQPPKKGSWGDWAVIEPRPNKRRITCSFCSFYQDDKSCSIHPIVVSNVGYDYWRQCSYFLLDDEHDTCSFRDLVNRVKKYDSPYQVYNDELYKSLCKRRDGVSKPKIRVHDTKVEDSKAENTAMDCYYLKNDTHPENMICTNRFSLLFNSICKKCPQYQREVYIVKGIKMSRREYEAITDKNTLPQVSRKEVNFETRQNKGASKSVTGTQKKSNTINRKTRSDPMSKTNTKPHKTQGVEKVLYSNDNCKYCINTKCSILQGTCTRGGLGCLFFKTIYNHMC